jgi:hypothetical protein
MPTYTVRVRIPFRTPAGRALDTHEQEIILQDPPTPLASLSLNVHRYGRRMRVPINVPTIDASGAALPDGTSFEVTWPGGIEVAPDAIEVASVARPDGPGVDIVKEIYRG